MADKKKRSRRRMSTTLQRAGGGQTVYQGERAGPPDLGRTEPSPAEAQLDPREIRFLKAFYETGSLAKAMRKINPKLTDRSCYARGSVLWKRIQEKVSREELYELFGLSIPAISRVVDEAMSATVVKTFITPRDGRIIESQPYVDHPTRLSAAQFAAKLRRLVEEPGAGGPIQINIVTYAPTGSTVWPGGGRPEWDRDGLPPGLVPAGAPVSRSDAIIDERGRRDD